MRSTRLLGFLVAVALAAVAGIGSAQAATPSAGPAAPHAHHIPRGAVSLPVKDLRHFSHLLHSKRPATGGTTANQTSTNWAGYAANGGTFTTVTSSWTEPDVSCNSNGIVAFWIGLDGWGSDSVEQDGTGVDCSSGSPQQFAWWETYPANSIQEYGDAVSAGDSLTSTVTDVGGGQYQMVLTVNFTGSTFNNTEIGSAGGQAIDMTDSSGNVIASTGADDGSGDFTVTYGG